MKHATLFFLLGSILLASCSDDSEPTGPSHPQENSEEVATASDSAKSASALKTVTGVRSMAALRAKQVSTVCRRYGLRLLEAQTSAASLSEGTPERARLTAKVAALEEMMTEACDAFDPALLDASPAKSGDAGPAAASRTTPVVSPSRPSRPTAIRAAQEK